MTEPQALLWAASAALFAWLALGTTLRVGGVERPGAPMLLQALIKLLPAFKLIRQPSRFGVMLGLSLAVLVGLACADLLRRFSSPPWAVRGGLRGGLRRTALGALLGALILFEYLAVPCPLLPARVSPWYDQLAAEPGDIAIVELPLGLLTSGHALYGQTVHGKRLVNGYVARAAGDVNPFVLTNPLLKALYLRFEPNPDLADLPAALATLAANDVRSIVIRKTPLPPLPAVETHVLEGWYRTLARLDLAPIYEDDELTVYPTGPGPAWAGETVARLGEDLELAALEAARVEHEGRYLLQIDLAWRATRDLDEAYDLDLSLRGPSGTLVGARSSRPEPWRISPHYPTSVWREGVAVAERYALPLPSSLAGGIYTLVLDLPGVGGAEVPVELADQAVPLAARLDVRHPADVAFGDQMWLLGYDWGAPEGTLELCWQALDVMGTNYKVFVHLLDGEGASAAQVDVMPRGWSYPTTLWSRQELFCDRVPLPVQGLPPGRYRAALGVYRPEIGRLVALDGRGARAPDDRVILDASLVVADR